MYVLNGAKLTKYFDAIVRDLLGLSKASVNWIVGIIITVSVENENYKI